MDMLTKQFTDAVEAQFARLNKDVQKALEAAGVADCLVRDLEKKVARRGSNGGDFTPDSWGQTFVHGKSADLAGMGRSDRVSMEIKAPLTTSTANAPGSAGDLVVPARAQLVGMPQRRLTIRNLLSVLQISSGSVERPRQITRSAGAAPVAEGARKPESSPQFGLETVPTRVIAHYVKASRQILSDAPLLKGLVDADLRYGLALEEERQLLRGTGADQDLQGMMEVAVDFDETLLTGVVSPNMIDKIGLAILQASLTDIPPDGIVMHPADWWKIRLTKDASGAYIMGDPGTVVSPSLFGLPVVPTQSQDADDFLVGAFGSQTLYDRWSASVEAGFEGDDFTRNLVTLLAEERVGFDPEHPEALIKGTFSGN